MNKVIPIFDFNNENIKESRRYTKYFPSTSVYKTHDNKYNFDISFSYSEGHGELKIPDVGGMVCHPKSFEQDKWLEERVANLDLKPYYVGVWNFNNVNTYEALQYILEETELIKVSYRCNKSSALRCIKFLLANSNIREKNIKIHKTFNSGYLKLSLEKFIENEYGNISIFYNCGKPKSISIYGSENKR